MTAPKTIAEAQDDIDDFDGFEDDTCEFCGSLLSGYDGEGCPDCMSCGGYYQAGTEECDWCNFSRECAKGQGEGGEFIEDMTGKRTFSPKQRDVIERLYQKVCDSPY